MKYDILVSGDYTNIKGLQVEQTFYSTLKCASCNYTHPKKVVLTSDSTIKEPRVYKCNFEMCCQSCKNEIKVSVQDPVVGMVSHTIYDKYDEGHVIKYCPVKAEGCLVSRIESKGAVLVEVSPSSFNVVTEDDQLFYDCKIDDKKCLAGQYRQNKIYSIVQCECKIREVE